MCFLKDKQLLYKQNSEGNLFHSLMAYLNKESGNMFVLKLLLNCELHICNWSTALNH